VPIDDLPPLGFGKAEMRGTTWTVHNAGNMAIARGQRCRVSDVKDLTLWISPE
jgi:membrane protein implicated in regulation of membrane protease activity